MTSLNKEKLNYFKNRKNYTNTTIAQLTNIPVSNIDKIFSGTNKNPTLDTIQRIAHVLECSIDDFIDYKNNPVYPIYIDKETNEIINLIRKKDNLSAIVKNLVDLQEEDFEIILKLSEKLLK